jgi:hypothetical protein
MLAPDDRSMAHARSRLTRLGVCALLTLLAAPGRAHASSITVVTDRDTYVTEHPGLGGASSNHGADDTLAQIGVAGYKSITLLHFDLSPYAGSTVVGDGSLTLHLYRRNPNNGQTLSVYPLLAGWNESTVTWNNFPGADPAIDSGSFSPVAPAFITFSSIDASVIQSWISSPGSNFGVMLYTTVCACSNDFFFDSRERLDGFPATLTFQAVPEPATIVLLGSGLVATAVRSRSRRRTAN